MPVSEFKDNNNFIPPSVPRHDKLPTEEGGVTRGEKEAMGISKILESAPYPATKEDLIDVADDHGAGEEVISMLEQLPDTIYNNPTDVSQALDENANLVT